METLETVAIVAGLSGVALLWIGATVGALGVVWDGVLAPVMARISRIR